MGILDDLIFHAKNYISYKTRDTVLGEFMRTSLWNDIANNPNISEGAKSKVAEDLKWETIRQHLRKFEE